jgi:hypothetical protein
VGSHERAFLAEAIMWDYELDFMPEGMEIVERQDLRCGSVQRARSLSAVGRTGSRICEQRVTRLTER